MFVFSRLFQSTAIAGSSIFSIIGWILYFIGICILQSQDMSIGRDWFFLFFFLFMIVGFGYLIGTDSLSEFRQTYLAFLTSGFVFLVMSIDTFLQLAKTPPKSFVNSLVNGLVIPTLSENTTVKTGAGFAVSGGIFMVFVWMFWMIIVGQDGSSAETSNVRFTPESNSKLPTYATPKITESTIQVPSPTETARKNSNENLKATHTRSASNASESLKKPAVPEASIIALPSVTRDSVVIGKATALYSYTANPADPTELSFQKGDEMAVLDNKGKWWHVMMTKEDGTTLSGIAPSNYLQAQ